MAHFQSPHVAKKRHMCKSPIIPFELFVEEFCNFTELSTNMAASNWRKHLEFTLRWKSLLLAHEIKYIS